MQAGVSLGDKQVDPVVHAAPVELSLQPLSPVVQRGRVTQLVLPTVQVKPVDGDTQFVDPAVQLALVELTGGVGALNTPPLENSKAFNVEPPTAP
jgi:hypothetical protein